MAKRSKSQLTADAALAEDYDSDEEVFEGAKRASADVMASRPIAKLKPRLKAVNGSKPEPKVGGAFGFLGASATEQSSKPANTVAFSKPTEEVINDQPTQFKSLNALFLEAVNNAIQKNPIADLRPILSKYNEYYDKVVNNKIAVKKAEVPKVDVKVGEVKNPQFSFGDNKPAEAEEEEEKPVEIKGPAFKLDTLPKSKNYGFKFGQAPPPDSDSDDDVKIEGPKFQLPGGTQIKDDVFKLPTKEEKDKKEDKPAFTFGQTQTKETPKFSFGQTAAPAFSFGSQPEPAEKQEKQESSKTPAAAPAATPAFSFSMPKETKEEQKPHQKPDQKPDQKPTFSFGSSAFSEPAKPAFSFSAPSNGFNFSSQPAQTPAVSNPFNFASKSQDTAPASSTFNFNFSAPKPEESKDEAANDDDEVQNEDVKGDFAVVKLTQKVDTKTGEENETVLYTKKSKVLRFDAADKADPYKSIGLGELKVLKNTDTGKSRILVRSEGSMNVLLNVAILKDVKYELIGKGNSMRIPTFLPDGKLETYIARVKTAEDGKNLLEKVQSCQ
ncbi:hypothetical protein KL937_003667 [Ogataea polymorpha]|uniref:uncharacterized protein n=1 Tax=Ogataea polymorpha TaxID=460523 RepID=UPI0007F494AA|nr:uncharacterized protein OGAPODRAFT_16367 [Ogataea polymorpha]KAG7878425.1 hypothetical protein KL937_003667 [Ogataea polymorpha]KAG7933779.1 hypothetical protein KL904_004039 [Ogataea polymorpha]OBA16894.1 hypothetical protein OGAPODRAFT_16367 [Ogataea polymorpha]